MSTTETPDTAAAIVNDVDAPEEPPPVDINVLKRRVADRANYLAAQLDEARKQRDAANALVAALVAELEQTQRTLRAFTPRAPRKPKGAK